jgi:serine/threonine-protein kinase
VARLCPRCLQRFDDTVLRCPVHDKATVEDQAARTVAGRYVLQHLLGVGGMNSTVWAAWHEATHRTVALKLLPATYAAAAERFQRGARLASKLNHPNVTIVHDHGQEPTGELFLVMELLEGETLHQHLKREGPLPVERALGITVQVLRALDHAHRRNVVHRDLKPGNLFLVESPDHEGEGEVVKVLDFGIAKAFEDDATTDLLSSEVTHQRQLCGTPHYMAPEQITLGRVDARTDLYAMGVVLYRMLVGRLPFEAREAAQLFRAHLGEAPPSFHAVNPNVEVPAAVEALVMRALSKAPEDRFQTASEMRVALRGVGRGVGFAPDDDALASGPASQPEGAPEIAAAASPSGTSSATASTAIRPTAPVTPSRRRTTILAGVAASILFVAGLLWATSSPVAPDASAVVVEAGDPFNPNAHPREPPTLDPSSVRGPVEVEVESSPAHVSVRTALRYLGETPLRLHLSRDTDRLFLEAPGYTTRELSLELRAVPRGERARFRVELQPAVAAPTPSAERPSREVVGPRRRPESTDPVEDVAPVEAAIAPVEAAIAPSSPSTPESSGRRPLVVPLLDEPEGVDPPPVPTSRGPASAPTRPARVELLE